MRRIDVRGARENNLQNIDVAIPRDHLISGKSSLVFDTAISGSTAFSLPILPSASAAPHRTELSSSFNAAISGSTAFSLPISPSAIASFEPTM